MTTDVLKGLLTDRGGRRRISDRRFRVSPGRSPERRTGWRRRCGWDRRLRITPQGDGDDRRRKMPESRE